MRIGFVGLGKLGLPVALAVETRGHEVVGYDTNPAVTGYVEQRRIPYEEQLVPQLLETSELRVVDSMAKLVAEDCDVIFVPVQTPHAPEYEGITRLPEERVDFDYSYLVAACGELFAELTRPTIVAIISTVLPGTIERVIAPLMNENVRLVYTPQFIAMGTTVVDFLNPEFTLIGVDDIDAAEFMSELFTSMTNRPVFLTDIRTAEGIKVFYNSFITAKTVLGNVWGELAEKLDMDAEAIWTAMGMATKRLMSPRYLRAGVGDGGGCHPRDNIALSWLARETGLSFDIFEALMLARERHMEWIADEAVDRSERYGLPIVVWGQAFKPGTNITTGSAARLLVGLLEEKGHAPEVYDPHVPVRDIHAGGAKRAVYVIATDHGDWPDAPAGSVVLDPFGNYQNVPAVAVERLGRRGSFPLSD